MMNGAFEAVAASNWIFSLTPQYFVCSALKIQIMENKYDCLQKLSTYMYILYGCGRLIFKNAIVHDCVPQIFYPTGFLAT